VTATGPTTIQVAYPLLPNSGIGGTMVRIERCSDQVSYMSVQYITNSSTSWADTGLVPGVKYYYRLTFRNIESQWAGASQILTATTPSAGPTGTTLGAQAAGTTWISGSSGGPRRDHLRSSRHGSRREGVELYRHPAGDGNRLSENTSYDRHGHALQGTNSSPPTATSTCWTKVHDPTAADFVSVTALSANQVRLDLAVPPNGALG